MLIAADHSPAALCIESEPGAVQKGLIDELVASLRARITEEAVRVVRCEALGGAHQTWRVSLRANGGPDELTLHIAGEATDFDLRLSTTGLDARALAQLLALHAAEAVRPAIDSMLSRLGTGGADALTQLERLAPPPTLIAPAPRPPGWLGVSLELGVLVGVAPFDWAGVAQLKGTLFTRGLGAVLGAALRTAWCRSTGAVRACGYDLQLLAGPQYRFEHWSLAALGVAHATFLGVGGSDPQVPASATIVWSAGAQLNAAAWPWRVGPLDLGLSVTGALRFKPYDFTVRGQTTYLQPMVELTVGPVVQLAP